MSERDQRRQLAVGAGTSPADPGGHPRRPHEVDVVQAVAALVGDLVEADGDATDVPTATGPLVDHAPSDPAVDGDGDLATGHEGDHGDAVAPCPDRGGQAVGPTAR